MKNMAQGIRFSFQLKMFAFSAFLVVSAISVIAYDYLVDVHQMLVQEYQSQALDTAEKYGYDSLILKAVDIINNQQKQLLFNKMIFVTKLN